MAQKASPNSKVLRNCVVAFLIGGAICTLGQVLTTLFLSFELPEKTAKAFVSITLIALSAILTGLKVYDKIAKHGGAGTLVPITGFANAIVSPAMEFKSEGYVMGIGAKMFSIAGPVLVYGTCASIIYGLIIFLFKMY
ncbi:stage V sporulation protein AC [Anaeromassilibacillus sp. Marseille-P3371]|uniref:stage V sporulation protein AC n=1 Tax=Anaeromassilibacillus sp. Marseille-P3371 TaxID=1944639 RepID=UPI000A1CE01E|nr:stage V sporulation protein AC [Anaeromassilibacillus sp. Marseille-P3371]